MEENDVFDMEDTQYENQPTLEPEISHQTEGFEINPPTVNVDIPVPELEPTLINEQYNPNATSQSVSTEDDQELGSCDCRSECKYNTGKTWKYSDYGYSD